MASELDFTEARSALDSCAAALDKLDRLCCEPGRSPRMKALGTTLANARDGLARHHPGRGDRAAEIVIAHLEDAGAQVGSLQVGCCAPNRLPLYAALLEELTNAQLSINSELGRSH